MKTQLAYSEIAPIDRSVSYAPNYYGLVERGEVICELVTDGLLVLVEHKNTGTTLVINYETFNDAGNALMFLSNLTFGNFLNEYELDLKQFNVVLLSNPSNSDKLESIRVMLNEQGFTDLFIDQNCFSDSPVHLIRFFVNGGKINKLV